MSMLSSPHCHMRTCPLGQQIAADGSKSRYPVVAASLLAVATLCVLAGCRTRHALPTGPGPEYEPPTVTAWDAGGTTPPASGSAAAPVSESAENFDSVAVGDWVDESDASKADAGVRVPGTMVSLDGGRK